MSNLTHKRKLVYVFQGGGALGSFQVGGMQALAEHDYNADMVVGISIGGINAAIMAGNPPQQRVAMLRKFWDKITVSIPIPHNFGLAMIDKWHNFCGAQHALWQGQTGFYRPRLISPWLLTDAEPDQLSFYDTAPLRETLHEVIDFDYLNQGHVRLCLGVTDLESGDFIFFDSSKQIITAEHIMASGALPPGFPAIKIDGRYYVDGGVYANTPLTKVLEEFADNDAELHNLLCFMFDLFPAKGVLPRSMDAMLARIKDIQYSSHSKRSSAIYSTSQNLSHTIRILGTKLAPEVRADPKIKELLKLGNANRLDLVHIIYNSANNHELDSKDYNFSAETAKIHYQQGYATTKGLIEAKQSEWQKLHNEGLTVYTLNNEQEVVSIKF
ncbi:MAG: hypothetical protein RLZZ293_163 [Pseudomonadota bacterium]|jgi:NTE family protein